MRKTAFALVLALVATTGLLPGSRGPAPAAAATGPKVAIIVGATHSATSTYRTRADAAYAEAIKYTQNVVKVYSPNATWAAVKAAVKDASIIIYMGHGNGFPSPYRTTPWPYSQNGFGLNEVAGQGDNNTKYYGEYYVGSELQFAPNAVVLFHHLCYASGNSEPGHAAPTLSVAKQRVDNYGAGFLKAGARAVIADGHMGPAYYIKALFTTRQTIDEVWRKAPNFHGNDFSFASVRSPGYTAQMDPTTPTSDYYRSIVGKMDLQTGDVTGASYAPTNGDPAAFTVPGAASVAVDGAGLFGDAELTSEPAPLALDTKLRVLASGQTAAGVATLQVRTFDGATTGWMAAADLAPRDSAAPQVWEVAAGNGAFSPNADGRQDTFAFSARLSESSAWRLRILDGDTVLATTTGTGTTVAGSWNGLAGGALVADGTYGWSLDATDGWGNASAPRQGSVKVDTVAPSLAGVSLAAEAPVQFSPNGDGKYDTLAMGWQTDEAGTIDVTIRNTASSAVRTMATGTTSGAGTTTWDGRSNAGAYVPDGAYTAEFRPRDLAGNVGAAEARPVKVYASLSKVVSSVSRFYPQDGDRFAKTTNLSFTLARPGTVTWRLLKSDGSVVRTIHDAAALPAGTHTFTWDGLDDLGAKVPSGTYTSDVRVTDDLGSGAQRAWVEAAAFTIRPSDTTPARRQSITVTAISSEPLTGYVYLRVTQPGLAFWQVRMTKVSSTTWKATVTLRSSQTGTMTFRVHGTDADGRWQASYLSLPLH